VDRNLYVVHYESGGIGHSFHVVVATCKEGDPKATLLWHGMGEPFKNYAEFLRALKLNKLDDTLPYRL
jgi:hypothetical protein